MKKVLVATIRRMLWSGWPGDRKAAIAVIANYILAKEKDGMIIKLKGGRQ